MDDGGSPGAVRRGLPKFREILRRPRAESDVGNESPDIDFQYNDSDTYDHEIAELYSYTEEPEFFYNKECYDEATRDCFSKSWLDLDEGERRSLILSLLNGAEMSDHDKRVQAVRSILFLCQGNPGECEDESSQLMLTRYNVFLLYDCGVFAVIVDLLNMEMENGTAASAALRKPAVSLADSADLRVLLNVLYVMVETIREERPSDPDHWENLRENFKRELQQPVSDGETLAVLLFGMVTKFCSGTAPHFPMKKVLLLLWKIVLITLGGTQQLYRIKNERRSRAGLPLLQEDPSEVCRTMRASSPPTSAADLIEQQQQPRRSFRGGVGQRKNGLDDGFGEGVAGGDEGDSEKPGSDDDLPPTPPRASSPTPTKTLPWTPKVRQRDLENFLEHTRAKFVGFQARNDINSLAGLPNPIHEGVKVLKQHLYVSLSEMQVKHEEELAKNPLSQSEGEVEQTPAEVLYQSMLPSLPQYMIALLKILLAAAPTSKAKTDSINILADVLPEEMPTTVLQSMKLGIDVNRHKEVIVKAIAALLLLLLKQFKLNHVYQFEFISQHLVFANCIPLVLKFFNQNISSYVTAKNTKYERKDQCATGNIIQSIAVIDFPHNVVGEKPELTAESLESGDNMPYCWRNLFSCINLLRILNKLTKWKHSRTMMLVVFKSAPILKRALKVKHAMMQVYILKLLKMQTKYLGRQWRKSNMKTLSAIYQKVRHRLTDDWAYGNDMDARPWDFQAEECALRACVDRFNNRRYSTSREPDEFEPVDNCFVSVLGKEMDLSQEFKQNYEKWLESEVFSTQIDWDQVLVH